MKILVIGAGMSGLTAAGVLQGAGHEVLVVDKARAVGGRMASKRFGDARFDHGAQHFSVRTPEFAATVNGWIADGVVAPWFESESITHPERGVEQRHRGTPAMRSICEHLARGPSVRTGVRIEEITGQPTALTGDGDRLDADVVVVTAPVPQARAMVEGIAIAPSALDEMVGITYQSTIAVMARMESGLDLAAGHAVGDGGSIAWIADNHHKGVSAVPAITIHSSADYAGRHLQADARRWIADLVPEAERLTGVRVVSAIAHRWRYSMPINPSGSGYLRLTDDIYYAGEALSHARVEGAFLSGRAVAAAILGR